MSTQQAEKDSILFHEGDVSDVAYYVVSGAVELSQPVRGGQQSQVLKTVNENGVFGELAIFDPSTLRPYTAKVVETAQLIPITPEEIGTITDACSPAAKALLTFAFDKMKLGRSKNIAKQDIASVSTIKKITLAPESEKMKALFKPVEITTNRLPFRIGGYPEGGEANRRDTLHLSIPSQANPLRISRQHCEITLEDSVLVVTDLGSRFCTTVNGITIGRGRGVYSAEINMGSNTLTLGSAEGNYSFTITCE